MNSRRRPSDLTPPPGTAFIGWTMFWMFHGFIAFLGLLYQADPLMWFGFILFWIISFFITGAILNVPAHVQARMIREKKQNAVLLTLHEAQLARQDARRPPPKRDLEAEAQDARDLARDLARTRAKRMKARSS